MGSPLSTPSGTPQDVKELADLRVKVKVSEPSPEPLVRNGQKVELQTSYSHHQLRDGLHFSSVNPNILYFKKNQAICSYNLETAEQETIFTSLPSLCMTTGGGYLVASESYQLTIIEETTKKQIYKARTSSGGQLNGVSIYKYNDEFRLVTSKNSNALQIWKLPEMQEVQLLTPHLRGFANYNFACVSPNGQYLACAIDSSTATYVWTVDPETGRFENEEAIEIFDNAQSAMTCAWDPTSRYLAVGGQQCVIFDMQLKSKIALFNPATLKESYIVRFSPNPFAHLLVIGESSERVHFVNTRNWEEQIVPITGSLTGVAFSDDGRRVYIGMGGISEFIVPDVDSLKGICVSYIKRRKDKWKELGWDISSLPTDLQVLF
jgi:WD40 repeat protein